MTKSDFIWGAYGDELVYIADLDHGNMSVTNDIANVLLALVYKYKHSLRGIGVIYRDSMGEWARVVHTNGIFKGFAPIATGSKTEKAKNEIETTMSHNDESSIAV